MKKRKCQAIGCEELCALTFCDAHWSQLSDSHRARIFLAKGMPSATESAVQYLLHVNRVLDKKKCEEAIRGLVGWLNQHPDIRLAIPIEQIKNLNLLINRVRGLEEKDDGDSLGRE